MRLHHLNCGTMCPLGGRLMTGSGRASARLVCHCLLIETDGHGLVLIDTGLGLQDVRAPTPRLSRFFLTLMRLPLKEEETALRQMSASASRRGTCGTSCSPTSTSTMPAGSRISPTPPCTS